MPTDIEIARAAKLEPILKIAEKIGIPADALEPYGTKIAKVDLDFLARAQESAKSRPKSKLILVTAINPTAAGEGKTTTSVGLADALRVIGKKSVVALREPSLGPCFGMKGGAAGGGYAQVVPMEAINLHFTGDFHAISAAHNLLAAMIDNHIYWGNAPAIDSRRVALRRVVDMNDRALRQIVVSLGGVANGYPRENGFDITVASEVMAIFCLARNLQDLQERLGKIVIAYGPDKKPITAEDLKAAGAMTVLLKDALMPNLVQTLEGTPAFIHGGPFANIAHGCNSVIATTAGLALSDYTVTEAGFGADLGAEKFLDIKCRKAGLAPSAAVIVATLRALKAQGGVAKADLGKENHAAVKAGLANLGRHVSNVRKFGLPVVVAINHFGGDNESELEIIAKTSRDEFGAEAIVCKHWAEGGKGAAKLAEKVVELAESGKANFHVLYPDELSLTEKMRKIAQEIYGAKDISIEPAAKKQIADIEALGFGHLPVCVAKTQYSFSTDPTKLGAPTDFTVPVREVRLSAGAGFVVMITGEIMTMPGLPKVPAAVNIKLDDKGQIEGLF
ncbi:formate--tetrahydrofolate ligase [Methylovirgula ligni]|uniref:Formate--tetrahydrofolate ligase n=1 Tax=Methylovirgula ligni TaxID=569860 RepID=A0A3D9YZM3_9HYPH|nr:formate--tetrahydrofolate ligase [Methylovirgula ligni]QAY96860.1 formate--tetrahydrofolate ligase [Methylovirgula ligni]REF88097.1 formate-tetrahydrofolate ligase [Methylovirgula ligni]